MIAVGPLTTTQRPGHTVAIMLILLMTEAHLFAVLHDGHVFVRIRAALKVIHALKFVHLLITRDFLDCEKMDYVRGVPVDSVLTTSSRGCEHLEQVVKRRCMALFEVLNPHLKVPLPPEIAYEIGRHLCTVAKSGSMSLSNFQGNEETFLSSFHLNVTEALMLQFFQKFCDSLPQMENDWKFYGYTPDGTHINSYDLLGVVRDVVKSNTRLLIVTD